MNKRQSLVLSESEWETLSQLAEETNSIALRGGTKNKPAAGLSSWRVLIQKIARKELSIFQPRKAGRPAKEQNV